MEGLFRGTWYRSEVKLEGDTIVPVPPFEAYNPFDSYYSAKDLRQGQRSLYLDFLSVNSDKPEEILSFCHRFGMLGDPEQSKTQAKNLRREIAQHLLSKGNNHLGKREKKEFMEVMEKVDGPNLGLEKPDEYCLPLTVSSFKTKQELFRPIQSIFPAALAFTDSPNVWTQVMTERTNHFLTESNVITRVNYNFQQNKWAVSYTHLTLPTIYSV